MLPQGLNSILDAIRGLPVADKNAPTGGVLQTNSGAIDDFAAIFRDAAAQNPQLPALPESVVAEIQRTIESQQGPGGNLLPLTGETLPDADNHLAALVSTGLQPLSQLPQPLDDQWGADGRWHERLDGRWDGRLDGRLMQNLRTGMGTVSPAAPAVPGLAKPLAASLGQGPSTSSGWWNSELQSSESKQGPGAASSGEPAEIRTPAQPLPVVTTSGVPVSSATLNAGVSDPLSLNSDEQGSGWAMTPRGTVNASPIIADQLSSAPPAQTGAAAPPTGIRSDVGAASSTVAEIVGTTETLQSESRRPILPDMDRSTPGAEFFSRILAPERRGAASAVIRGQEASATGPALPVNPQPAAAETAMTTARSPITPVAHEHPEVALVGATGVKLSINTERPKVTATPGNHPAMTRDAVAGDGVVERMASHSSLSVDKAALEQAGFDLERPDYSVATSSRGEPTHTAQPPIQAALSQAALSASTGAVRTQATASTTAGLFSEPLMQAPDSPEFPEALLGRVRMLNANGAQEARLNLHPAEWGRMSISVAMDGDAARVAFTVDNPQAREALELAMPRLRELLAGAGLQLAEGSVAEQGDGQTAYHGESEAEHEGALFNDGAEDLTAREESPRPSTDPGTGLFDAYA